VTEGTVHSETASIFRVDGQPITLFRHQAQAVAKATAGQSFVVTTGTGSGKSLCFFIPIIDAAIRAGCRSRRSLRRSRGEKVQITRRHTKDVRRPNPSICEPAFGSAGCASQYKRR
jgi:hypothetical protein